MEMPGRAQGLEPGTKAPCTEARTSYMTEALCRITNSSKYSKFSPAITASRFLAPGPSDPRLFFPGTRARRPGHGSVPRLPAGQGCCAPEGSQSSVAGVRPWRAPHPHASPGLGKARARRKVWIRGADARRRPGRGGAEGTGGARRGTRSLLFPGRSLPVGSSLPTPPTRPSLQPPPVALPRCTPHAEAGGQRRGSRGGGRAAPAQMPLFVYAAPSSRRRADDAGPGGPRRPGSPEPARRRALPAAAAARSAARPGLRSAAATLPRCARLRALPARPRSSPAAVTPPRGRPSSARAGRGTHLGVPAGPGKSAACGLHAATRSRSVLEGQAGRGRKEKTVRLPAPASHRVVSAPPLCVGFLQRPPHPIPPTPRRRTHPPPSPEAFPRHSQPSRPGVRQKSDFHKNVTSSQ